MNSNLKNIPPVVKNLLIINILVLFVGFVCEEYLDINFTQIVGLHSPQSELFEPYQFITHMFMHGDVWHLVFNMYALFILGRMLETVWGSKRFLIYYMITGLGAAVLHLAINSWEVAAFTTDANAFFANSTPETFAQFIRENIGSANKEINDFIINWTRSPEQSEFATEAKSFVNYLLEQKENVTTVGASGAVFGVLLAFGMLFPNTEFFLFFIPVPIKAKYFVIGYGAIELYLGFQNNPSDNIAHFAHLGGMLFGFLLIKYWKYDKHRYN